VRNPAPAAATLALLGLLGAAVPGAQAGDSSLDWRGWNAGLQEARKLERPVLVDVYTQWCGWCKRMDRDVYTRPEVREYLGRKFVTIKIDAEASVPASYDKRSFTSRSLASHFRVTGYPTTLFLNSNAEHLVNVPGYVPADKFMLVLRYIGEGYLDRGVSWEDFKARDGR